MLVATIDAQWEGMGDVGSARYEPALLPPCSTIRVLSYRINIMLFYHHSEVMHYIASTQVFSILTFRKNPVV